MPLGAFRLNGIAKFTMTAAAEVIRAKKNVSAVGNAQLSTAQSKFGRASAYFDGTGDAIQVASDNQLTLTGDFTIEGWFRCAATPTFFTFWNTADHLFYIGNSGGPVYAVFQGGQNRLLSGVVTIAANTWYHFAFVRSGSTITIYHNGTAVTSATWSSTITTGAPNYIGLYGTNYNPISYIDEFRISKTARYTADFTPPTAPFVNDDNTLLLLHMDGTDASTYFEDDNGVRQKSAIASTSVTTSTTQRKFGGTSAYFDGTAGRQLLVNSWDSSGISTQFTWEAWVYFTSTTAEITAELYMQGTSSATQDFHRVYTTFSGAGAEANRLYIALGQSGAGSFLFFPYTWAINTWYHIAISRDSNNDIRAFVNGTQIGTTQNNNRTWTSQNANDVITIGRFRTDASRLRGYIDEYRISKIARYTANFTAPTAPFVNDANTVLLIHADGTSASTYFEDDNGVRSKKGVDAFGNIQIDTAQSKFGGSSALFDGTSDYLVVSGSTDFAFGTSGEFTYECWVRPTSVSGYPTIFGTVISAYIANGYPGFYSGGHRIGNIAISTNTWSHLAWTRSGGNIKVWVNGQLALTQANSTNFTGGLFYIGGDPGANFAGHMDEIRISKNVRYTDNFTPPTAPFQNDSNTVLLLHCDGTDASTVFVDDNGKTPN